MGPRTFSEAIDAVQTPEFIRNQRYATSRFKRDVEFLEEFSVLPRWFAIIIAAAQLMRDAPHWKPMEPGQSVTCEVPNCTECESVTEH